jgi:hypothetical protein
LLYAAALAITLVLVQDVPVGAWGLRSSTGEPGREADSPRRTRQGANGQRERREKKDPLLGKWVKECVNGHECKSRLIDIKEIGEFSDSERPSTSGTWLAARGKLDDPKGMLRIADLTFTYTPPSDDFPDGKNPFVCNYELLEKDASDAYTKLKLTELSSCDLAGDFRRIRATKSDDENEIVDRWLEETSGRVIEFTHDERLIAHNEIIHYVLPGQWINLEKVQKKEIGEVEIAAIYNKDKIYVQEKGKLWIVVGGFGGTPRAVLCHYNLGDTGVGGEGEREKLILHTCTGNWEGGLGTAQAGTAIIAILSGDDLDPKRMEGERAALVQFCSPCAKERDKQEEESRQ